MNVASFESRLILHSGNAYTTASNDSSVSLLFAGRFGGLNAPLRSGKTMPFEGGVRVPTFVTDFRRKQHAPAGVWKHMSYISDLFPTLASFAGKYKDNLLVVKHDNKT